jgi:hypothetical protein
MGLWITIGWTPALQHTCKRRRYLFGLEVNLRDVRHVRMLNVP